MDALIRDTAMDVLVVTLACPCSSHASLRAESTCSKLWAREAPKCFPQEEPRKFHALRTAFLHSTSSL